MSKPEAIRDHSFLHEQLDPIGWTPERNLVRLPAAVAGVFQIDLNYPINSGAGAIQAKADAIRAHFKRGTVLSGVELGAASVANLGPVDGWYRVAVSVAYRSFVAV